MPRIIETDVVIIGGGAAGAHAALKAHPRGGRCPAHRQGLHRQKRLFDFRR